LFARYLPATGFFCNHQYGHGPRRTRARRGRDGDRTKATSRILRKCAERPHRYEGLYDTNWRFGAVVARGVRTLIAAQLPRRARTAPFEPLHPLDGDRFGDAEPPAAPDASSRRQPQPRSPIARIPSATAFWASKKDGSDGRQSPQSNTRPDRTELGAHWTSPATCGASPTRLRRRHSDHETSVICGTAPPPSNDVEEQGGNCQ
jgi:hypothetical protein